MAHALTAHFRLGDFNAAAVADDTLVLDAFVLSAVALPVTGGSEDAFAEQTALLGFQTAVVDCFRVLDFAMGPGTDGLRTRNIDRNCAEIVGRILGEQLSVCVSIVNQDNK